jgi:hypothetical protein
MSAALTVFVSGIAAAAVAPPPQAPSPATSLIPAHVGGSVSYHYDAVETGPRGTTNTRAVLTLTRVVNDRVTITVTPDEGPATAVVARLGRDGALRADSGADASDIPLDRPLGGFTPVREARAAIPQSVRVLAALLASRPATGTSARTWPFAAAVGPSESSVAMTARAAEAHGTETTVVADGTGEVQIAAVRDGTATQPRSDDGTRGGGQRGGGVFFPGGGQGGQGGVYGSGRGRRGGQGGGQGGGQSPGGQNTGSADQPRTVPATVNLHVESTFRGGRLVLARGSDAATAHATAGDATTTVRWTLTAL